MAARKKTEEYPDPPFPIPSVWHDRGYLVLAYDAHEGRVEYISTYEGAGSTTFANFQLRMKPDASASICPVQLALSFLVRSHEGFVRLRIKIERRLVTMLQAEQLMQMSERRLAEAYRSVMGAGPLRISNEQKEARVKEMVEQLQKQAEKRSDEESAGGEAKPVKAAKPKKEKAPKAPKAVKVPKPKKEKAVKAKAPKEPKPKKEKVERVKKVKDPTNPFREGTMKSKAFALFKRAPGAETAKLAAQIVALGAAENTARGWIAAFRKVPKA